MKLLTLQASLFLILLSILFCLGSDETVPSVKLCKPTEPNLLECWKNSVALVTLNLIKGIPSRNLPALQRLYVSSYKIKARTASIDFANLVFEGVHNFDIVDMAVHPDSSNSLVFEVLISELILQSDVVSRGRYADFSIAGNGKVTIVIKNLVMVWKLEAEYFTQNETTFRSFYGHVLDVSYDSIVIQQQDLIEDEEVISALTERIRDKTSAFNEHFLNLLKNTFVKRMSHYGELALNTLPIASE